MILSYSVQGGEREKSGLSCDCKNACRMLMFVTLFLSCCQVFRLQVNNGIPIKSWFDDPSDNELISLIPFLETLAEADDVRPVIAQRFGNKE